MLCEHSSSQYKHLVDNGRENLSEENAKIMAQLYYNGVLLKLSLHKMESMQTISIHRV